MSGVGQPSRPHHCQDRARPGCHQRHPHCGGGRRHGWVPGQRGAARLKQQGGRALPEGVEAGCPGNKIVSKFFFLKRIKSRHSPSRDTTLLWRIYQPGWWTKKRCAKPHSRTFENKEVGTKKFRKFKNIEITKIVWNWAKSYLPDFIRNNRDLIDFLLQLSMYFSSCTSNLNSNAAESEKHEKSLHQVREEGSGGYEDNFIWS